MKTREEVTKDMQAAIKNSLETAKDNFGLIEQPHRTDAQRGFDTEWHVWFAGEIQKLADKRSEDSLPAPEEQELDP